MNMQMIFRAFICLWLPLVSHAFDFNDDNIEKGLLWKIERPDVKTSYLFGTIHVEDERITKLPVPVKAALKECKSFTMEVILDFHAMTVLSEAMFYKNGKTLKSVIGGQLYKQSMQALKNYSFPLDKINSIKPWAVVTVLSMPKPKTGIFLDLHLYYEALRMGKATHGLETVSEQVRSLSSMSIQNQIKLLAETLKQSKNMPHMFKEMTDAYLSRELGEIVKLSKKYRIKDKAVSQEFMVRLVDERNHRMIKRMIPRLDEGKAFIAVGALHLPGKQGLIALLRERGFKVSPVY